MPEETGRVGVRYFEVTESGQRIDNYLARELKSVPKSRIYRMLRRGEVRVNGGRVKPMHKLRAGDRVRVPPVQVGKTPERGPVPTAMDDRLSEAVLYEDSGLLVLDKPAGVAVHGGSGIDLGVIEALRGTRNDPFLELAHRLDRDTSGCLVVAKSRSALRHLHSALRAGQVSKHYDLLVDGRWPANRRSVRLRLERYHTRTGERRVRVRADGKPARTDFTLKGYSAGVSWLEAVLKTGRTHQIRVHTAASGSPILGESKYETDPSRLLSERLSASRLCLHASSVAFQWQGRRRRFEAAWPNELRQVWCAAGG